MALRDAFSSTTHLWNGTLSSINYGDEKSIEINTIGPQEILLSVKLFQQVADEFSSQRKGVST
ncbi:MAG: hypothetical protein DMG06_16675 [Acidobacteria bacterium]|nr:MAG: hypothetical protein DMG06_16675 [Acidobacteriota bacterium]